MLNKKVLDNGLTVFHFPKKGFANSYAVLATSYGAVDSIFETSDGKFETPQGVAHFLEHKMFEQENSENALALFGKTGASPNAFTSQTLTAYFFECTSKFEENLEILLDFVANPYFTKENVDKEQGIIGQEIDMVEDNPDWKVFTNLFRALYKNHPIKESIIGTKSTIAKITHETLYLCHKAFYNSKNMVLCVASDTDFDTICNMAERIYRKPETSLISRDYKTEPKAVFEKEVTEYMEVDMPLFMIGFKDISNITDAYKNEMLANICADILFSKSSKLYTKLYTKGLIDAEFGSEYVSFPSGGTLIVAGRSKNPELVLETIKEYIENLCITQQQVDQKIKVYFGKNVRMYDNFDDLCLAQVNAFFKGANFSDFEKIEITLDDVKNYIKNIVVHHSLSMVKPKK